MSSLNNYKTYLRTWPVYWPVFSTKNYVRDVRDIRDENNEDGGGWWNYRKKPKIMRKKVDENDYL